MKRAPLLACVLTASLLLPGCSLFDRESTIKTYPAAGTGYLRVADSKRYLQFEDGTPFVMIGANESMTWPDMDGAYLNANPARTEAYFQMLREHGVNTIRVMAEYSQDGQHNLEQPLGTFDPLMVAYWDQIFQLAEKYDIYVLLTPWDTFWMNENWGINPYNAANGGPAQSKHDFLTSPQVMEAQKNRFRFLIDRWGGQKNLLAWEIMNEMDMWWEATPTEIKAWIDEMSTFVKTYEQQKWGKTHMITASTAKAVPDGVLGEVVFNHPNLDFANTHLYAEPAVNNPTNAIDAAISFQQDILGAQTMMKTPKPYTDTESGPITSWITDRDLDHEYFHNMSWAHLMAGGAGFGMRWPYLEPHTLTETMRDYQQAMAAFARTVDWSKFASHNLHEELRVDQANVLPFGSGDGKQAIVWLLQDTRTREASTIQKAHVTVQGMTSGSYEVRFWDTYKGVVLSVATQETADDGTLTIPVPDFGKDLALHILPRE